MDTNDIHNKFKLIKKWCNENPENKTDYLILFNDYLKLQLKDSDDN